MGKVREEQMWMPYMRLSGSGSAEWYPVIYCIKRTRTQAIESYCSWVGYSRAQYDNERDRGDVKMVRVTLVPDPDYHPVPDRPVSGPTDA